MAGHEPCAPLVIVTFPARVNAANAEQAAGQVSASLHPA